MLTASKSEKPIALAAVSDPSDLRIGELLASIDGHGEKPLVFFYEGRPVKAGYHVTEVKAGQFSALDCGANPEAWSEIFIQLWDVDEGGLRAGDELADHEGRNYGTAVFPRKSSEPTFNRKPNPLNLRPISKGRIDLRKRS